MSKVFSDHAVSIDGYISGRDPSDAEGGFGPDQPERRVASGGEPS